MLVSPDNRAIEVDFLEVGILCQFRENKVPNPTD
jgi:hypothetical protein